MLSLLLLTLFTIVHADISVWKIEEEPENKLDMNTRCILAALWGLTVCTCIKCEFRKEQEKEQAHKKKELEGKVLKVNADLS